MYVTTIAVWDCYSRDTVRRSSMKPQVNCYFSLFVVKMIVSIHA